MTENYSGEQTGTPILVQQVNQELPMMETAGGQQQNAQHVATRDTTPTAAGPEGTTSSSVASVRKILTAMPPAEAQHAVATPACPGTITPMHIHLHETTKTIQYHQWSPTTISDPHLFL